MAITKETNEWVLWLIKQLEEIKLKEIRHLDEVGMREGIKEMLDPNYEEEYEDLESKLFHLDETITYLKDLADFKETPEDKMNEKYLAAHIAMSKCQKALREYAMAILFVEEQRAPDVVNANSYVTQIEETLENLSDLKTTLIFD